MQDLRIREVIGREILDCRGEPTIEVDIRTEGGLLGRADAPVGRSTGEHEAQELRDEDETSRYFGRGVLNAVQKVNRIIGPALKGRSVSKQREIDELLVKLDGTKNRSNLGANALTAVSIATAKAAALSLGLPLYQHIGGVNARVLPVPFLNLINGGKLAATELDFQEHMIVPLGAKTFSEAIRIGTEVYFELGRMLAKKWGKHALNVADEGGYTPPGMRDPREAFDAELKAIEELGYEDRFVLALDAAASHLYNKKTGKYTLMMKEVAKEELIDFYEHLVASYPVQSIEDPFHQEDFESFATLTKSLDIQIIGDDLFVTNPERISRGIHVGAANALLLKVNQVGTLSESLTAAQLAFRNNYGVQVSERSGQTEDTWLADLSVALNAGQIKTGAPCRSERTAQYNQLLRIEEELGTAARYAGKDFRKPV